RHTRSKRDWSSDVCSSDLLFALAKLPDEDADLGSDRFRRQAAEVLHVKPLDKLLVNADFELLKINLPFGLRRRVDHADVSRRRQIGRASCRERGEAWGGGG